MRIKCEIFVNHHGTWNKGNGGIMMIMMTNDSNIEGREKGKREGEGERGRKINQPNLTVERGGIAIPIKVSQSHVQRKGNIERQVPF